MVIKLYTEQKHLYTTYCIQYIEVMKMEHEWIPKVKDYRKEVWYKDPLRDMHLVIRKDMFNYEGTYYPSRTTTWKWTGKTHREVLRKAIKDIEGRRK